MRAAARAAGVTSCVIPAVEASNFDTVRLLAHQHGDVYALGIHPMYTPQAAEADLLTLDAQLQQHRSDPRLVAVGEIGIDGFVPGLNMARQQMFYKSQLKLAQQHDLPVILHVRRSADQLLKHLRALAPAGGWHGMLAAGAMLTAGKRIGARQLWVGRPAKHLRDLDEKAVAGNKLGVTMYVENGRAHKQANGLG